MARVLARTLAATLTLPALLLGVAGCSDEASGATGPNARAQTLRLGYYANVTHAGAVYGVATGSFQTAVGETELQTYVFNAGPGVIEAMRGGSLDAAFIGPSPTINGFLQTDGELLRIVAGTTYGGASLVVQPEITDVSQLADKRVATPQLGNTQDVAAKTYFADQGVDVDIINTDNARTLDLFISGDIAGGWVPEPWASRMVIEGGGTVLVEEASLWPDGKFATTHLIVYQDFLRDYPATVDDLIAGLIRATGVVATNTEAVRSTVNDQIEQITGQALAPNVLKAAFANITPSLDPIAASLRTSAQAAADLGLLPEQTPDLAGIYDLRALNAQLRAAGRPTVSDAGLGVATSR